MILSHVAVWNEEQIPHVAPQDWKDANITPYLEKGSRKECSNYRRIFLLSIAAKRMLVASSIE